MLGNVFYMRSFTAKRFHWVMLRVSAKYQSYDQPNWKGCFFMPVYFTCHPKVSLFLTIHLCILCNTKEERCSLTAYVWKRVDINKQKLAGLVLRIVYFFFFLKRSWVWCDFKGRVKADNPNQTLMLTEIDECFASSRNQDATLWMAINFESSSQESFSFQLRQDF